MNQLKNLDILPFVHVQNVEVLLPIVKSRFPHDFQIYNMVLMHPKFIDSLNFYTLGTETTFNTWILVISEREDHGRDMHISIPLDAQITTQVREAFSQSKLFNWDKSYCFATWHPNVSAMILDISVHDHGKQTTFNPCNFHYMDFNDAKDLIISSPEQGITLEPLDIDSGVEFLYKTWKFSNENTLPYLKKLIERNPSYGVLLNGKIISGVAVSTNGYIGYLYTHEEHRNKNYGKMAMLSLIKDQTTKMGFIPCSLVERHNPISITFHEKIGMKFSHPVDIVYHFEPKS